MYCICCKKDNVNPIIQKTSVYEEDLLWKKEKRGDDTLTINNEMIKGGIIHIIDAGYGSNHDGAQLIIAICDECIAKNLGDGTILFFNDYMIGDKDSTGVEWRNQNVNKSKQIYRRRKNLDNLTDSNG
jgi:hypothetical protein